MRAASRSCSRLAPRPENRFSDSPSARAHDELTPLIALKGWVAIMHRPSLFLFCLCLPVFTWAFVPDGFDGPRHEARELLYPASQETEPLLACCLEVGTGRGAVLTEEDSIGWRDRLIERLGLSRWLPAIQGRFAWGQVNGGWRLRVEQEGRLELAIAGRF